MLSTFLKCRRIVINRLFFSIRQSSTFATAEPTNSGNKTSTYDGQLTELHNYMFSNGHKIADLGIFNSDNERLKEAQKMVDKFPIVFEQNENIETLQSHLTSTSSDVVSNYSSLFGKWLNIYCGQIGYELSHLPLEEQNYLVNQITMQHALPVSAEMKKNSAKLMIESEAFDEFMGKRFGNVKRYGLEGTESMLVAIDTLLRVTQGTEYCLSLASNMMIGMPHRGRLNLLINLLDYPPTALFHKLSGKSEFPQEMSLHLTGDVISHIPYQKHQTLSNSKSVDVVLLPNSSHLEAINPVVQGATYAMKKDGKNAVCLQIHGDAAFSAQGIVMETLSLTNLPNFSVNGSIHLIVNNQLGFTTPNTYGRSTRYASDPAKMIDAPIIHVNAEYPEHVFKSMVIANIYREEFKKDVVVDLIGYRRHGHNELDEPSFTQPLMYNLIRERDSIPMMYAKSLEKQGLISNEDVNDIKRKAFERYDQATKESVDYKPVSFTLQNEWKDSKVSGEIEREKLVEIAKTSVSFPEGFAIHPRLRKHHVESRLESLKNNKIDWATAEAMAIGSLMAEGFKVRLSGQDVGRGTFSQRHFQFYDQINETIHTPLHGINQNLEVVNSNLSEFGVLGFEYGMSIISPTTLPIWEAQFGDFFNGAQIMIDAFITSGETKWGLESALTILLPHGYDGAGPEHSSCRIERWLQLCDDSMVGGRVTNMRIVNPTTPSNYFHVLKRQMMSNKKCPLIVVSPKTLLRLPMAVSKIEEMSHSSSFIPIIVDEIKSAQNVVFVSGKFYYELVAEAEARKCREAFSFVRIEELCPFPLEGLKKVIERQTRPKRFIWAQEEPQNQGAYSHVAARIQQLLPTQLEYVGRDVSACPATGISMKHKEELKFIMDTLYKS